MNVSVNVCVCGCVVGLCPHVEVLFGTPKFDFRFQILVRYISSQKWEPIFAESPAVRAVFHQGKLTWITRWRTVENLAKNRSKNSTKSRCFTLHVTGVYLVENTIRLQGITFP